MGVAAISSDDPSERDLFLANAHVVLPDKKKIRLPGKGILVSHDKTRYLGVDIHPGRHLESNPSWKRRVWSWICDLPGPDRFKPTGQEED